MQSARRSEGTSSRALYVTQPIHRTSVVHEIDVGPQGISGCYWNSSAELLHVYVYFDVPKSSCEGRGVHSRCLSEFWVLFTCLKLRLTSKSCGNIGAHTPLSMNAA